ncbi:MAG: flagellar hook assembly protein FlgD [Gammaproteobacteria bacterium]|nr:flagellar hook assembly protein FlgD [Gammaproteobacteria bacterium]
MSNGTLPTGLDALSATRLTNKQGTSKDVGQDEFFKLMIAQLKNQDPMKPMENGEFLTQIAQFSTVNGIRELQNSFSTLASSMQSSQALQASTMVGRTVFLDGSQLIAGGSAPANGAVVLPLAASDVTVTIEDGAGQVVREIHLGAQQAGNVEFTWEGLDDAGGNVPQGIYNVKANAVFDDYGAQAVGTLVKLKVESVTVPGIGQPPQLNLSDRRSVTLSDVIEVM